MGIDYCSCKRCGDSFPDVIDYVGCDCGETWCSNECAKKDKYKRDKYDNSTCKYCRKEDYDDAILLKFALEYLNKTRKELIQLYKNSK